MFWERVAPLIPRRFVCQRGRQYQRKPGAGHKAMDPRQVFEAIVFVLRSGCQWKSLPKERSGSASSVHRYFQTWLNEGSFLALWRAGLAEYDAWRASPGDGKAWMEPC